MAPMTNYRNIVSTVMGSLLVACALIVVASPYGAKAEISCQQVASQLAPCINHVLVGGGVSPVCCQGVKKAATDVKTSADLRASCQCVKDSTARFPGVNYGRVNEVAPKCGTSVPYTVSPNLDCSK
ncbi:unnamed protein product [Linum trigynum]|uniref:Non-specific lipid-transfer protein n=1 Tax=Linum trigynum TaxID=586398 RepID=A0AAV2D655_9ROSI